MHHFEIDDLSGVVDDGIALYGCGACLDVHLHHCRVGCAGIGCGRFGREDVRVAQWDAGKARLPGDFAQVYGPVGLGLYTEHAVADFERLRQNAEQLGCQRYGPLVDLAAPPVQ
jgi:hypothetical protein